MLCCVLEPNFFFGSTAGDALTLLPFISILYDKTFIVSKRYDMGRKEVSGLNSNGYNLLHCNYIKRLAVKKKN